MKKLVALFSVFVLIYPHVIWAADIRNDASTNLVFHLELEETAGSTRVDSHTDEGNADNFTDNNTVGQTTSCIQGDCADFGGTNQYLQRTDDADNSPTGDFTASMWVNADEWPDANGENDGFVEKLVGAGNNRSFVLAASYGINTTDTAEWRVGMSSDGSGITNRYIPRSISATGTWYHLVFRYDASAGEVDVFVNGALEGGVFGLPTSVYNGTAPFTIGASVNALGAYWDGRIDEFGFYNGLFMSTTTIETIYNSGTGIPYEAPAAETPATPPPFFFIQ